MTAPLPQTVSYDRIALARAIAGMQFRSWRNTLLRGMSRDPIPAAIGLLFAGASAFASLGFGFAALVVVGLGGSDSLTQFWLAAGLLGSLTLVATLSSAAGESGDVAGARMLQVYPVLRRDLLVLDVVAQLFAPTLIFFLPAVGGLTAGLALAHTFAGRGAAALLPMVAIPAGMAATALLLRIIAAGVVIGGRRVREVVVVGLSALFLGLTFLGPLLQEGRLEDLARSVSLTHGLVRFTHAGAAAHLAIAPDPVSILLDLAVLAVWLAGGWMVHRRLTGRILDGETGTSQVVRRARGKARVPALFLGPAAAAAIADFRTMTRIPTVWIQLLMPGIFGLFLGRSGHSAGNAAEAEIAAEWTPVLAAFGAQVFFTSPLFSNLFGSDHAGATHYVLSPAPAWRLLAGKAVSRIAFGAAQVGVFFAAVSFRMGGIELPELALAFGAWLAGALWVAAAGSFISIRLPFRMSHGLNREPGNRILSSLLGQLLVASVLIPPGMMIVGGRVMRGDAGYLAGIAVSAAAGAVLWTLAAVWCTELWPSWGPRMVEELSQRS